MERIMSEAFAITPEDIDAAANRIEGHVLRTPRRYPRG